MINNLKKFTTGFVVVATLFFAALAILSIWDIIEVEQVMRKSLYTLVVLFFTSVVILFVLGNINRPNQL